MNRAIALLVVAAVTPAVTLLPGCSRTAAGPPAPARDEAGASVRVVRPRRVDLQETAEVTGQLEGRLHVTVAFQVDGRLTELVSHVGEIVTTGQVIARLDDAEARARVSAAEAGLETARSVLEKTERGARPQEIKQSEARRDEAAAAAKVASEELGRVKGLLSKRAASQQQLDNAQAGFDVAAARLRQAEESLALTREGARREDRDAARSSVKLAEAQLALAKITLQRHTLVAPFSGVVASRPAEPGDVVMSMPSPTKIIELVEMDPILFAARVPELEVPGLAGGKPVQVRIDAFPREVFPARVYEVTPVGDVASRTFLVKFALANPELRLKPAMFARARLDLHAAPNALTVPAGVLRESSNEGTAVVHVADAGVVAAREVRTGLVVDGRAEILGGLAEEDQVIVEGGDGLKAGQKVSSSEPLAAGKAAEQ